MKVNGTEITKAAVEFELQRLVKFYSAHMSMVQITEQMESLRKKAVDQAIGTQLLMEQARRQDIQVPITEVDEAVKKMIHNAGGDAQFLMLLKKQGLNMMQLRDSIENGRKLDRLVAQVLADSPEPTEDEIQAHYKAHADEYATSEQIEARHILIKPETTSEPDKQTAISRLEAIRGRLLDGAEFADEAAAHSDCPSGKKTGGSLGWFSKGMMTPVLDQAVFTMEDGDISDVLESPLGFHVVQRTAHKEPERANYSDVAERIRDFLRHVHRGERVAAYVAELRAKAVIEDDVKKSGKN